MLKQGDYIELINQKYILNNMAYYFNLVNTIFENKNYVEHIYFFVLSVLTYSFRKYLNIIHIIQKILYIATEENPYTKKQ